MINLLPDEYKDEIRAARTNVLLVRYIFILISALIVLSGLVVASYIALNGTRQISESKVAENQQRVAVYQNIRSQADAFKADLATAKSIMDSEVSYAQLIYRIANIVPRNVILDDLSLDPTTFGTSMTMNASAKTVSDATRLPEAFSNNNEIFSEVKLQSLRSGDSSGGVAGYPVKVTLSVVINRSALQ